MKLISTIFFLLCLQVGNAIAQSNFDEKESIRDKQRVIYVYNFTQYITWSDIDEDKTFKIGVLGNDEENLVNEFKISASQKTIKGKKVEIIHYKKEEDVGDIHILYVHKKHNVDLQKILPRMYVNHTLLVSENYKFQESMINFIEFNNEFHFNVSEAKINRAGLLVAPRLLNFSIQQQKDWEEVFQRLETEKETIEAYIDELEMLSKEIEFQRARLDAQRRQIKKQQLEINAQKGRLDEGEEQLAGRIEEVGKQRRQLSGLLHEIERKNIQRDSLSVKLKKQLISYEDRKRELDQQADSILAQKSRIAEQQHELEERDIVLSSSSKKIKEQGNLIYSFTGLFFIIIILAFFAFREYKRKRRSEERVRDQNVKLVALNDSLDSFVYRVSHDLKSPVINVKNMIGMLKEFQGKEEDPMVPEIMKNMDLSANRLEATITDLLELSRIEKVEEAKEPISIEEIFSAMLPEYKNRLKEIEGSVTMDFDRGGKMYGAKVEMVSILQNLLTNSIKYRSKERKLEIVVSSVTMKDKTILRFSDNGQGLDLKQFNGKIFQMFQRFTQDTSIDGTGVGMYIIKKLVDNNKGTIELSGGPDIGLTYEITLPRRK